MVMKQVQMLVAHFKSGSKGGGLFKAFYDDTFDELPF